MSEFEIGGGEYFFVFMVSGFTATMLCSYKKVLERAMKIYPECLANLQLRDKRLVWRRLHIFFS